MNEDEYKNEMIKMPADIRVHAVEVLGEAVVAQAEQHHTAAVNPGNGDSSHYCDDVAQSKRASAWLLGAFLWHNTPEGSDYWGKMRSRLVDYQDTQETFDALQRSPLKCPNRVRGHTRNEARNGPPEVSQRRADAYHLCN